MTTRNTTLLFGLALALVAALLFGGSLTAFAQDGGDGDTPTEPPFTPPCIGEDGTWLGPGMMWRYSDGELPEDFVWPEGCPMWSDGEFDGEWPEDCPMWSEEGWPGAARYGYGPGMGMGMMYGYGRGMMYGYSYAAPDGEDTTGAPAPRMGRGRGPGMMWR